jgi:hypothetical protein
VVFAGKPKEDKIVCTIECTKPGYVIYKAGSGHLHAFPEDIDPFPVIVRTKKDGGLGFSVVPEDKMQDVMKSHGKMKADIHLHGIKIDREGFYDLNEVRKLLNLFENSFSTDPKVRERGIDLTKWELDIADHKEATKRMRLTLEIISQDQKGIREAVEIAEQTSKSAHNPEVMRLIPDPVLPTFREAGKIR